jgi:predicted transport protein
MPDDQATLNMIANLKTNTGKTLEEWLEISKNSGFTKHGEIVKYLKDNFGIGHGFANLIAHRLNQSAARMSDDPQIFVEQQYSGGKANLRPIYDRLVDEIGKFGDDVELVPMKAYVSVRRKKQFAIIQPSTATRVDVGIKLKDTEAAGRLENSGNFNGMVSHRVKVGELGEVNSDLVDWLKQAYNQA